MTNIGSSSYFVLYNKQGNNSENLTRRFYVPTQRLTRNSKARKYISHIDDGTGKNRNDDRTSLYSVLKK